MNRKLTMEIAAALDGELAIDVIEACALIMSFTLTRIDPKRRAMVREYILKFITEGEATVPNQLKLETLGDYRRACAAIGGENCEAVKYLDRKIATEADGDKAKVLAAESQMMMLLGPMLLR